MTPTVRIDADVYQALKKIADPFEDTPNTVIRRLLVDAGLIHPGAVPSLPKNARAPHGKLTPQAVYEEWLLRVIWEEFEGEGHKRDIVKTVRTKMEKAGMLTEADYAIVSSGEPKCENTIAWGRQRFVDTGIFSPSKRRGWWELSPKGVETAKALVRRHPSNSK